jgi:superfamily II DNA/RNA helicase
VHRIGRTGRYDKTGTAITFVNKKDSRAFSAIQDKVGDQLEILKANSQEGNSKGTSRKSSDTNKSDDKTRKNSKPEKKRKPSSKKESSDDNKSDGAKKPSSAGKKEINKKMNKKDIEDANRKVQNLDSVDVVLKGNNKNTRTSNSTSSRSSSKNRKQDTKKSQEPVIPAERIKNATKRNQNTPKPAKGLWGLIKSFFS